MKKIISMITSIAMALALIPGFSITGFAEDDWYQLNDYTWGIVENGIEYRINRSEKDPTAYVANIDDSVTDAVIPEYIGEEMVTDINIEDCINLEKLTIPATVTDIDIIKCLNISECTVNEENPNYCTKDGIIYDKEMKKLYYCPPAKAGESFTLPDGLIEIGDYAFSYCTFETINLPNSLITIGERAFSHNDNLKEFTVPENVENIFQPFYECNNLETLTLLREINFNPLSSSTENKDEDYLSILHNHTNNITVYVPDNKTDIYMLVSGHWNNTLSTVLPLSEIPKEIITGDVNYDQTVSTADVVMMQKSFAKSDGMKLMKAADINGDGKLNVFDLILLKRKIQNM